MTEAMRPFLRDRKRDVPLCGTEDAVRRIMEWFMSGSSIQGQLEDAQYNEPLYAQLGWQDERHFDVVSSFWTVFACAVIVETRENKAYARSRRYYTFPDYVNYVTPWVPGGKYGSGSGEKRTLSFPERYFMRPAIGRDTRRRDTSPQGPFPHDHPPGTVTVLEELAHPEQRTPLPGELLRDL